MFDFLGHAKKPSFLLEAVEKGYTLASKLGKQLTPDLLVAVFLELPEVKKVVGRISKDSNIAGRYLKAYHGSSLSHASETAAGYLMDELLKGFEFFVFHEPLVIFGKLISENELAPVAHNFFKAHGITQITLSAYAMSAESNDVSEHQATQAIETQPSDLPDYCIDLGALMATKKKAFSLVGREDEVKQVVTVFKRPLYNQSVALIGDVGVGKRAIVEHCISFLVGYRCLEIDTTKFVIGTMYRGQMESRVKELVNLSTRHKEPIIYFINKAHRVGAESDNNIIEALVPFVLRGEIKVIISLNNGGYQALAIKDLDFKIAFPSVEIKEPTREELITILTGLKPEFETVAGLTIDPEVFPIIADQLVRHPVLPGANPLKSISFMNMCFSRAQVLKEKSVTVDSVHALIHQMTNIEVSRLTEGDLDKLKRLPVDLSERVVGQDNAVQLVSLAVQRRRTGISDPNRPASFIFLGPTGTGKTLLAKQLARLMFDDENALIRIDMSEYMEEHNVARFIGAPPGYEAHAEGGQLTEAVKRKPYAVILLDEVEKAHPKVFNILLQVLSDGRLTDGQGNTVNFKDTIIIMTSNLGADYYRQELEKVINEETMKNEILAKVRSFFSSEFLNRIDEIVIFCKLLEEHIRKIAALEIKYGVQQQLGKKGILLIIAEAAQDLLAKKGFDPLNGARPLQRVIMRLIENELALKILNGQLPRGSAVTVDAREEVLIFDIQKPNDAKGAEV